jgi:hypothetical protein
MQYTLFRIVQKGGLTTCYTMIYTMMNMLHSEEGVANTKQLVNYPFEKGSTKIYINKGGGGGGMNEWMNE